MKDSSYKTVFEKLGTTLMGTAGKAYEKRVANYTVPLDTPIFKTKNKEEYEQVLNQEKQDKLLAHQWIKASSNVAQESLAGLTNVKLMYRDSDLMDAFPEIGAALDILSEESSTINDQGKILNISSNSDRIKSVLEDLFVNRLDIHITLPMICRAMCKYGNNFQFLNVNKDDGILGWKQLPVYEIERLENGMTNPYMASNMSAGSNSLSPEDTKFVWTGKSEGALLQNWQIGHFRLLTDSIYLPYGVSWLHKARRHWRMLSIMEDMLLIYRLERSIERRVFKIYVGNIDDKDVPAYVNDIANNFKRTPIVDPMTGQIDLRKNFLDVSSDYFIPVRDQAAVNPIETLAGANNLTAMDDINYMQNKVLSALRIPKTFLNFQETQGKGQNLSLLDIRFVRTVNRVQQALLMELNKIATIHLYLLGFTDDLTNFTLSMNNPSSQSEMLELENLEKRINVAKIALSDPGNGIQLLSWKRVLKTILKFSDAEITENLLDIRMEKALASELAKTTEIIKTRTGTFDAVDRIYGDLNAEYSQGGEDGAVGGGGDSGGGSSFGGFGEDMDMGEGGDGGDMGGLGELDNNQNQEIGGESGSTEMANAPEASNGNNIGENKINTKSKIILEHKLNEDKIVNELFDTYIKKLNTENVHVDISKTDIINKGFIINEEINDICNNMSNNLINSNNNLEL